MEKGRMFLSLTLLSAKVRRIESHLIQEVGFESGLYESNDASHDTH